MFRSSLVSRIALIGLIISTVCLTGCPPKPSDDNVGTGDGGTEVGTGEVETTEPTGPAATAKTEDVEAAKTLLDGLGSNATYTLLPGGVMTEIVIKDGSPLNTEDIALLGKLTDLKTLQIYDCRDINDEMVGSLTGLENLTSLALTNTVMGDSAVDAIVGAFPNLTALDLSSNANLNNSVLKTICELEKLERLTLIQTSFNDLGTGYLAKLKNLRLLDLRGNMQVGDMSMEIVGGLPNLVAFKHRSTSVGDFGVEYLAQSKTLKSLLLQDFETMTSMAGEQLAKIKTLEELEIFRCQQFGSEGVLALKGMNLSRLTLRDLPVVDDMAMEVFTDLPNLKRLYLHELPSVSDYGLENLQHLKSLEVLDIWEIPQMTDATVDVIATLPNLKELSIRTTGVTDAAVDKLLAMPNLQSLTFKDNGGVTDEGLKKLSTKDWAKLDIGQ